MRIAAAVLADSAVVRDGTITIVNAGINIFRMQQLPTQLAPSAAFMFELDQKDRASSFDLRMTAHRDDDPDDILGELLAEWRPADGDFESSLTSTELPIMINVAFPLHPIIVTAEGLHTLIVTINNEEVRRLHFLVLVSEDLT